MSVNSSCSSNASLPSSSYNNMNPFLNKCFTSRLGTISITAFSITGILILLPLYIYVLHLGQQLCRQQRFGATMSHSDLITCHMVVAELISVLGAVVLCCGVHTDVPQMMMVGNYLFIINLCGQMLFHVLTCVERYLAVVHPITYLSLRKAKGIRIRNVTIGCVWLLCFAGTSLISLADQVSTVIMSYSATGFALIVVSFCSLSVLCVLIRPRPGDGGGRRQRVDQSKLRAFYTIMVILGMLLVRFAGNMLVSAVYASSQLGDYGRCLGWFSGMTVCLPSSLVLPLLFLQRAGKLPCCNKK